MELSVFRNEDVSDRGFLSCDERCIPALKVDPAGENFLAILKARNCPPRNFQAVRRGCTYRLVLPSAGHLQSVPLQQQVAKINFKKRSFCLLCRLLSCRSSVIGAIGLYHVLFHKTYLAEPTLMMGETHNLCQQAVSPPAAAPDTERTPVRGGVGRALSRNFPSLCILSRNEKVLLICRFQKFISLWHWCSDKGKQLTYTSSVGPVRFPKGSHCYFNSRR